MMTSQTVTFGSRQTIFIVRVMQVLLPLFGFALMDGERNPLIWIGIIFAFTVWELFMFSMVFATLNEQGLAYLRWGKWKEATWAEIRLRWPGNGWLYQDQAKRKIDVVSLSSVEKSNPTRR